MYTLKSIKKQISTHKKKDFFYSKYIIKTQQTDFSSSLFKKKSCSSLNISKSDFCELPE